LVIAHFLLIFALFERAITLFIALLKRAKKERSLIRSFQKSDKKSDSSFVLLQRATKRAIVHSLFFKEQRSKQSHNRSFENER